MVEWNTLSMADPYQFNGKASDMPHKKTMIAPI
jgi:hypothetical protein